MTPIISHTHFIVGFFRRGLDAVMGIAAVCVMIGVIAVTASAPGWAQEQTQIQAQAQDTAASPYPAQTISPTSATSSCIGDLSTPECAVDTWMSCLVQDQDPALCERAGWGNQEYTYTGFVEVHYEDPEYDWHIGDLAWERSYQVQSVSDIPDSGGIKEVAVWDSEYQYTFPFRMRRVGNNWQVGYVFWPAKPIPGSDYPSAVRFISDAETTSDCLGNMKDLVCAMEALVSCDKYEQTCAYQIIKVSANVEGSYYQEGRKDELCTYDYISRYLDLDALSESDKASLQDYKKYCVTGRVIIREFVNKDDSELFFSATESGWDHDYAE